MYPRQRMTVSDPGAVTFVRRASGWARARRAAVMVLGTLVLLLVTGAAWLFFTTQAPAPVLQTTALDRNLPSLSIDGYRFHLEMHGSADRPVVVVLHGGPGLDYRSLLSLRALASDYRVVFYDQRGSGLSPRVAEAELTLARFVADLDAIGRAVSPSEPVRLIGHSWGAMLATAYLAQHPHRVSHAVLAEPGFLTPELGNHFLAELDRRTQMDSATIMAALRTATAALLMSADDDDADARLDYVFTRMSTFDGIGNPLRGYFCGRDVRSGVTTSWRLGARAMTTLLKSAVDAHDRVTLDLSAGARTFPREVLFVSGACNEIIGPRIQERHRRLFPHATLAVVAGAGHTMLGERPDEALRLIRDYFEKSP